MHPLSQIQMSLFIRHSVVDDKEADCRARDLINPGFNRKSSKKRTKCSHCNKRGHTAEQCWKLHPELKPRRTEDNSTAFAIN